MPKATTTWIGRKWELYAHKYILPGSILVTNTNRNAPYDIEFENMRVNVKAAKVKHMGRNKSGLYFDFKLKDHAENCDFFLLIGYRNKMDKTPQKIWFFPSCLWSKKEIVLGINHKGRFKDYEILVPERLDRKKVLKSVC